MVDRNLLHPHQLEGVASDVVVVGGVVVAAAAAAVGRIGSWV